MTGGPLSFLSIPISNHITASKGTVCADSLSAVARSQAAEILTWSLTFRLQDYKLTLIPALLGVQGLNGQVNT